MFFLAHGMKCEYQDVQQVAYLGKLYNGAIRKQATTARLRCLDSNFCHTHFLDLSGCSTYSTSEKG